jgi:hypothetical protein
MNDEALPALWISAPRAASDALPAAITAVLQEDQALRDRERKVRVASIVALVMLSPSLLWAAAFGVTPLVRAGYGLMGAGVVILIATEWIYLAWSRHALPGPADARSQLQKTSFILSRQAALVRFAALWSAPVFIGVACLGLWMYRERSAAGGYLLWAIAGAAWIFVSIGGTWMAATADARRRRLDAVLGDFASTE